MSERRLALGCQCSGDKSEEPVPWIRNGSTGFTSSLNISNSPSATVEGKDGKGIIEPGKKVLTPSPENKWGVWTSETGDFVNLSGDGNGKGYEFTTGGVRIGLDYRLTKNIALGMAVGYAHTSTSLSGDGTSMSIAAMLESMRRFIVAGSI